jgi:hypothetical protein
MLTIKLHTKNLKFVASNGKTREQGSALCVREIEPFTSLSPNGSWRIIATNLGFRTDTFENLFDNQNFSSKVMMQVLQRSHRPWPDRFHHAHPRHFIYLFADPLPFDSIGLMSIPIPLRAVSLRSPSNGDVIQCQLNSETRDCCLVIVREARAYVRHSQMWHGSVLSGIHPGPAVDDEICPVYHQGCFPRERRLRKTLTAFWRSTLEDGSDNPFIVRF